MTLASSPVIFSNPTEKFNPFLTKTCYCNTLTYPAHARSESFAEQVSKPGFPRTASTPPGSPARQSRISLHPSLECCCARGLEDLQDKQCGGSVTPFTSTFPEKAIQKRKGRSSCASLETWLGRDPQLHTLPLRCGRFQPSSTLMDSQHLWQPHRTRAQHGIQYENISITQQRHLTLLFHTSREDFDAAIDHNKSCLQEALPCQPWPQSKALLLACYADTLHGAPRARCSTPGQRGPSLLLPFHHPWHFQSYLPRPAATALPTLEGGCSLRLQGLTVGCRSKIYLEIALLCLCKFLAPLRWREVLCPRATDTWPGCSPVHTHTSQLVPDGPHVCSAPRKTEQMTEHGAWK